MLGVCAEIYFLEKNIPDPSFYLKHSEDFHPALVGILLLVTPALAALGKTGEGIVENLGIDKGNLTWLRRNVGHIL